MTGTAIKVIALLSTFAGRACLAAAVAIAALTPCRFRKLDSSIAVI